LEKGLRLAPGDPMGSLQASMLLIKKGRTKEARDIVREALRRPIGNMELYQNLVRILNSVEKKAPEKI